MAFFISGTKKYGQGVPWDATTLRFLGCGARNKRGHDIVKTLWRQFFSDPSQWGHTHKVNSSTYPDFKHKKTGVALWMKDTLNPPWVKAELTCITPGPVSGTLAAWNAMISKCVKANQLLDAVKLYHRMQAEGVKPNAFTFARIINACASLMALEVGRHVHAHVIESSCESDVFVGSTLVDMYAKCGSIEDAQNVFQNMCTRDVVCWTGMLAGFVRCEQGKKALEQFVLMQEEGVKPNAVTFVVLLNACASIMDLDAGKCVHAQVIETGCESDVVVGNALLDMYAKCGNIEDAQRAFNTMPARDIVSWNAMVAGYMKCDQGRKALDQYALMQVEGVKPDPFTFVAALKACASVMALEEGRLLHAEVIEKGYELDVFVGNTLVEMYAKCGSIEDAQIIFQKLPTRNVVSWNAIMAGYVKCEQGQKAIEQFARMQGDGIKAGPVTFVIVLNACASVMALEEGRQIHAQVIESGCESNVFVGNTLIDMYAKCGSIEDAQRVFHKMPMRNVVSWNAILGGFAMHGQARKALQLFQEMYQSGVEMHPITFICLLSACSHGGLVDEGVQLFESMGPVYGISPTRNHYICMVDLLGRAGRLNEAEDLLRSEAVVSVDSAAFRALLGACRRHGNEDGSTFLSATC